jgi:hypothetical protein
LAAPQPNAHSTPNAAAVPPIMIQAASGVGAVAMASPPSPAAHRPAPIISGPSVRRPERLLRNRLAGGVARARASGANENAAADIRPKAAALSSGIG